MRGRRLGLGVKLALVVGKGRWWIEMVKLAVAAAVGEVACGDRGV